MSSEACHIDYFCCATGPRMSLGSESESRNNAGPTVTHWIDPPESSPLIVVYQISANHGDNESRKCGDEGEKEEEKRASTRRRCSLQPHTHRPLDTPLISGFLTYLCSIEPPLKKRKEIVPSWTITFHLHIPTSNLCFR